MVSAQIATRDEIRDSGQCSDRAGYLTIRRIECLDKNDPVNPGHPKRWPFAFLQAPEADEVLQTDYFMAKIPHIWQRRTLWNNSPSASSMCSPSRCRVA